MSRDRMRGGWARGRGGAAPRYRRFGLQARAILAFAIGAAMVSATLAFVTFTFVRRDLMSQRSASVLRQTFVDARLVKLTLGAPSANVAEALSTLAPTTGAHSFIYRHGLWFSASASLRGTAIPATLTRAVVKQNAAEQTVVLGGVPTIVVGVPLPSIDISYFEEHPLTELEGTLSVLATVLVAAAIVTTVGGALAGWWASRRLIRPLTDVVNVATDIAGGTLDRRLPDDPDLQPLVTSFNDMVTALQRRIERDARFASDVSHELRSPLTTIGASVELLGSYRDRLPAGGTRALDTLRFEVTRFSTMVKDLLEIARIDAGAADLHFTDLPLDELVRITASARAPTLPVHVAPGARGICVHGDRRRLQRVVENLLENADAHAGGPLLVEVGREGAWATITVEDAGPGIPSNERERVFERFYRGAVSGRRRSTTGAGLGLALVAEHVRAHNGTVRIDDRPSGGARVTVVLPAEGT